MRILLTLCCLFYLPSLIGGIHHVKSLSEIDWALESLTQEDLVVFDIDHTLIIPKDKILRPCGLPELFKFIFQQGMSLEQLKHFEMLGITQIQVELLEKECLSIIDELQANGIPTIALTAMKAGQFGDVVSMEEWRFKQLKNLNIDFSLTFPNLPLTNLIEEPCGKPIVSFANGIIASAHIPKGVALTAFLDYIDWMPSRVIFVDDRLDFVESVEESMHERNIEFIGFHYTYAERLDESIDRDIATYQLSHFVQTNHWLSDDEIRQLDLSFN